MVQVRPLLQVLLCLGHHVLVLHVGQLDRDSRKERIELRRFAVVPQLRGFAIPQLLPPSTSMTLMDVTFPPVILQTLRVTRLLSGRPL